MKAFRDPVHNIILFDKDSEKILIDLIDTREFQRLRHIKQLGLSSFTYPGAEHSRFVHSLGVTHLMKRFIDKISSLKGDIEKRYIEELSDNRILALTSALLHDIGHGPFSHALEKTTKIVHEKWTIGIILGDTEVNGILEDYRKGFAREVADVIQRTHESKPVVKLLSSQLDTDRIDYLLRDSKMTGAGYGSFDLEWMINTLRIGEVNGDIEVGLDLHKGFSIAEDFVMARYYMYVNVYFHKATRSAELLIDKVFERASQLQKEGEIELPEDLNEILTNGIKTETVNNYINLTDNTMWHYFNFWARSKDEILSNLCNRLLTRRFFKSVNVKEDIFKFFSTVQSYYDANKIPIDFYLLRDQATSSSYKDPYIMQSLKTESEESEREVSEQIFLFDNKGHTEELSNKSDIIRQIRNKKISIERFYMPEEHKNKVLGG
ncbi:MAG: HD domain-containing protein [Desulfitobacteriaceae bacterium]